MKAIKSAKVNFKELSKFPAVKRDLALLIDKKYSLQKSKNSL